MTKRFVASMRIINYPQIDWKQHVSFYSVFLFNFLIRMSYSRLCLYTELWHSIRKNHWKPLSISEIRRIHPQNGLNFVFNISEQCSKSVACSYDIPFVRSCPCLSNSTPPRLRTPLYDTMNDVEISADVCVTALLMLIILYSKVARTYGKWEIDSDGIIQQRVCSREWVASIRVPCPFELQPIDYIESCTGNDHRPQYRQTILCSLPHRHPALGPFAVPFSPHYCSTFWLH